jgi:putative transposase
VLMQKRHDTATAKRFFQRVLRSNPLPRKIVTDQLRIYPAAKADISELACEARLCQCGCTREQPCREQPPADPQARMKMCGFRDARRAQAFLSCFGPIRQHFALPRHQMLAFTIDGSG